MARLTLRFPSVKPIPEVVCASGALGCLRELDHRRVLFFLSNAPVVERCINRALRKQQVSILDLETIYKEPGEPSLEMIDKGFEKIVKTTPRYVCAIGGGSTLDWAKLSVRSAMDNPGLARPKLWLAPTTCGSGAECGDVSVFSDQQGRKTAIVDETTRPDRVILDGNLIEPLVNESGYVSALPFLADALTHGIEANLSIVPNGMAKQYGVQAIRTILNCLSGGQFDSAVRTALLEASCMAGIAAMNCSVGVAHAFAHACATCGVGHGQANGWALIQAIRFNQDTPQMGQLLSALGVNSCATLIAQLDPLLEPLRQSFEAAKFRTELSLENTVDNLAELMMDDVAARTNPVPLRKQACVAFIRNISADLGA